MAEDKTKPGTIALNKKARHDYFIEETLEAGLSLEGWEVKSLRAGKGQITETYVQLRDNEAWLFGAQITPLLTASTHIKPDPTRTRKLLLHRRELDKLEAAVNQKGYTCVCTALYWKGHLIKARIDLAHDVPPGDIEAPSKDEKPSKAAPRAARRPCPRRRGRRRGVALAAPAPLSHAFAAEASCVPRLG